MMPSDQRYANFDVLRLFLALEVVFSHIWGRSGLSGPYPLLAIPAFLSISGFMILQSWRSSRGPGHFWIKRATRLLPAFTISFALLVALFGWRATGHAFVMYLTIGGVGFASSVNPPLWSLSAEEVIYLLLALSAGLISLRNLRVALAVSFIGYILLSGVYNLGGLGGSSYLALIPAFILGLYAKESNYRIPYGAPALLVLSMLLAIANHHFSYSSPMLFVLWSCSSMLATLELGRAKWQPVRLPLDISYGVYIYHYPIFLFMMGAGITDQRLYWLIPGICLFASLSVVLAERPILSSREWLLKRLTSHRPVAAERLN